MPQLHENRRTLTASWSVTQWPGYRALELVRELNEHCLEILSRLARCEVSPELEFVKLSRDLWRELDKDMRRRAAQVPVLLLDIQFRRDDFWQWARTHRAGDWNTPLPCRPLPARFATELTRKTLMLAWYTARTDISAAGLLLGMSQSVATTIAGFGLHDIDFIAARHGKFLRPRWENIPLFWRMLLTAARDGDDETLCDVHLHALQLLGSELFQEVG